MNERTIHTHLYSTIAYEVLQSVEGQLSDGIWENSPAMEKYWRFSNVAIAPDSEVLIEISSESGKYDKYARKWLSNGFHHMSDAEVIKWFAAKVKHIMVTELKGENVAGGWKRDNDMFETGYLSYHEDITVSDVYIIYESLLNRHIFGKYDSLKISKVLGSPKSEADTKVEETRRANIAKLEAEWSAERKALEDEHALRIKEIEADRFKAIKEMNDKYQKLLRECS